MLTGLGVETGVDLELVIEVGLLFVLELKR
jgi:hypothetical protein